jgi:hypothetical protein
VYWGDSEALNCGLGYPVGGQPLKHLAEAGEEGDWAVRFQYGIGCLARFGNDYAICEFLLVWEGRVVEEFIKKVR